MATEAKKTNPDEAIRRFAAMRASYNALKSARERFAKDEEAFYEVVDRTSLSDTQKLRIIST